MSSEFLWGNTNFIRDFRGLTGLFLKHEDHETHEEETDYNNSNTKGLKNTKGGKGTKKRCFLVSSQIVQTHLEDFWG